MTLESFSNQFPSIEDSHVLSEEEQERIEGGACDNGCKKQCLPGKKKTTNVDIKIDVSKETDNIIP